MPQRVHSRGGVNRLDRSVECMGAANGVQAGDLLASAGLSRPARGGEPFGPAVMAI